MKRTLLFACLSAAVSCRNPPKVTPVNSVASSAPVSSAAPPGRQSGATDGHRPCGPWFDGARLQLVSNDGGVSLSAWAEPSRDGSAEHVYRRYLYELRNVDLVDRDDGRLFVHWIDPCDEPVSGFVSVKVSGTAVVALVGRWPEGATENMRPVFHEMLSRLEAVPPGACPARPWLRQPGHFTFRLTRSDYAEDFEAVSHPNWICPPFAFRAPEFETGQGKGKPVPVPTSNAYW